MNPVQTGSEIAVVRLNWGCGPRGVPGWINSNVKDGEGIDLCCDIRNGLPLDQLMVRV